ncbi:hypothetical protein MMC07_003762 [Pseudocyphellaria aurata]|nr:hypothetical protein [Pseudocyphellaria aurata]
MNQAGSISGAATRVLHKMIKAKTPEEKRRLPLLSNRMQSSDSEKQAHREAMVALARLETERKEAIRLWGDGVRVTDWWRQDAPSGKEPAEQDVLEDVESVEEAEKGGFGDDNDNLSVVSDGEEVKEEEGEEEEEEEEEGDYGDDEMQLEPPEPVSPA